MTNHLYPRAPRPLIAVLAALTTSLLISSCGSDGDEAEQSAAETAPKITGEPGTAPATSATTTTVTARPTTARPTTSALTATSAPTTTAAPTTTSATTTTTVFVNPLSDADIAANMLLEPSEYAPGWTLQADIAVKTLTLDRTLAASVTGCADFLDTVFESNNRPATIEGRGFQAPPGPAAVMGQYVVVFPTENNAQEMFDALLDPRFSGDCLDPYFALTDLNGDEFRCDTTEPATPALFGEPVAPTTDIDADQIAFRSDTQYWEDFSGAMHGPETVVSATARIGRTITIIEAITVDEFGEPFITEDQFHTAITTAVARARDALSEVAD